MRAPERSYIAVNSWCDSGGTEEKWNRTPSLIRAIRCGVASQYRERKRATEGTNHYASETNRS